VRESSAVTAMRQELGQQLAARRKEAGYLQRELGVLVDYSRTAIANAESGGAQTGRELWERLDRVLGTGDLFTRGYLRIQNRIAAESRAGAANLATVADPEPAGAARDDIASLSISRARQACLARGWPVDEDMDGRLWLVTGTVLDVLEVPRDAGLVAMGWWLYTRGVPDEIRGLPALPDPDGALAVITGGPCCYFLTRSGACPWTRHDTGPATAAGSTTSDAVRWHADGGRVPMPPSPIEGSAHAAWAHAPSGTGRLVSPMALLHILAQATAATRDGAGLMLPGGVRAVPAPGTAPPAGLA
jgi:transcriptional regulator with XRE-family HTH domain